MEFQQSPAVSLLPPHIIAEPIDAPPASQITYQCDCACAINPAAARLADAEIDLTQPYHRIPSYNLVPLNETYRVLHSEYLHRNPVVLNDTAVALANGFEHATVPASILSEWSAPFGAEIVQKCLQQMLTLGILVRESATEPITDARPETLTAWLHLTDACNMRCTYCYLPHNPVHMAPEIGRQAVDATFRSAQKHGYSAVKFKYAGGEPLLHLPLLLDLHRRAQAQAAVTGLALDGVVLSNGTLLTEATIRSLQQTDLRLMISLDGLHGAHDRQRPLANGKPSFAAVAAAIELALHHGLVPDISITVTGSSIEGLPDLLTWVLEHDLPFGLNFYRENDFSADAADLRLEEERIISGMLAAYKVLETNLPRRSLLASLVDLSHLGIAHQRTCAAGDSYLVFDPQGRISKCQMQLNPAVATLQDRDPLLRIRSEGSGLQNLPVSEKEGCKKCEWRHWCSGGCPLLTYRATGRYDVKSPNCSIYKALFPEALRLEGLRLLRYLH